MAANSFGIWRDYPRRPTIDPEGSLSLEELSNRGPTSLSATGDDHPPDSELPSELSEPDTLSEADRPFFWPFPNPTIWRVMSWLNNGSTAKSEAEVTVFVPKVILSPDFSKDHLIGFDAHQENQHLDKALSKSLFRVSFKNLLSKSLSPLETPLFLLKSSQCLAFFTEN